MNQDIIDFYVKVRRRSEEICKPLNTEDYIPQPAVHVSPMKWQLAHTTWFFEQMILKKYAIEFHEFDESFNFLFNSYYNNVGERTFRADRGSITRPTVAQVYEYRSFVDQEILEFLKAELEPKVRSLFLLGLNHEQQHQELMLTDLKFTLSKNPLCPVYSSEINLVNQYNSEVGFVAIEEGIYKIGSRATDFCFDNELGRHKTYLQNFEISRALVTNGEFLEFIDAGGYSNFNLWLDEGWAWINQNEINSPLYWEKVDDTWFQYSLDGYQKVDMNAILCHISFYEANAFAAWKGMRLPTEFEWETASTQLNWGKRWEWTNSAYLPYPNFKIDDGAVGEYNGKFMINQMVLRGASTATAEGHSRNTYRNFFHPHYQWQFTGIRLAK